MNPRRCRVDSVRIRPPIYLDPELRERLAAHAKAKGISIDQLANELLKRDLDLIEAAK